MPASAARLRYDRDSDRWCLCGQSLHCGDGLEVQVAGRWLPVRIEYTDRHGWVLLADDDRCRILPSTCLPARPDRHDGRW